MLAQMRDFLLLANKPVGTRGKIMASRPIFMTNDSGQSFIRVVPVEFKWHAGMSKPQKQLSIRSLHAAAQLIFPDIKILEVSSQSESPEGAQLSAFNLTFRTRGRGRDIPVECAFQASKVFENGGPHLDLLEMSPADAKRDARLQNSGRLIGFSFFGQDWPLEPLTAFYDWIYINALHLQPELVAMASHYNAFTDIAFNPEKSFNCQAGSVALYGSLIKRGLLNTALKSKESYLNLVVNHSKQEFLSEKGAQGQLFQA